MAKRKITIYFLKCPLTNKVRYIGRTSCSLESRLSNHMNNNDGTIEKLNWIKRLKSKNLKPFIIPIETVSAKEAPLIEHKWIWTLKNNGIRIFNRGNSPHKHVLK